MKRWLVLVPLLCGLVAYAPTPWSELVWDDAVLSEYQLPAFRSVRDAFLPPAEVVRWTYAYYRPVVVLSHMLDRELFGPGAAGGPHVVNLLLHLLATACVWLLARRLLGERPGGATGALLAATIFAVHPAHTESVSWIAGRSDLLATVLLLPALLLALAWRDHRSPGALLASALLFLAAVLAKETGILALVLVPWLLLLAPAPAPVLASGARRDGAASAGMWTALGAAYAAATFIYLALRQLTDIAPAVLKTLAWTARFWQLVAAAAWYLIGLVAPWPQSALVSLAVLPGPVIAVPVVLAALAASGAALWLWRARGETVPLIAVGWFWATISLPLWIAVFALNNTPLAERYLYLPSVALALGVGLAWCMAGRWRTQVAVVLAVIAVVYAGSTLQRALVWRDDLALWSDTVRKSPEVGLAWTNLGFAQLRDGADDAALASFRRALEAADREPKWVSRSHNGIGVILVRQGDLDQAEEHLRTAIGMFPSYSEPYLQMGLLFAQRAARMQDAGDRAARDAMTDRAILYLSGAIKRRNNYFAARLTLAGHLAADGRQLEREGQSVRALRRYEAARDQLAAMLALMDQLIPVSRHAEARRKLASEVGLDADALGDEVGAGVARLSRASNAT
jgi:tetratricopeptide (TPR) repeat protein